LRRSFSLAGSVEEGAEEEEAEAEVVVAEAAAFAVAGAAALGFLGPLEVLEAADVGAAASPAPLSDPEAEEEGEETEANCRRGAIKASGAANDDDAFEASQRPDAPAFAAPLAPWSKLLLCLISESRVWRNTTSG